MDGKRKKANGMGKGRVGGWSDGGRDDEIVRKKGKYWLCCYFGISGGMVST
jgi:hypothetical protein